MDARSSLEYFVIVIDSIDRQIVQSNTLINQLSKQQKWKMTVLEPQDLVNHPTDLELDIQQFLGTDVTQQKRNSALVILKMKEKYHLSQTAIDNIIGSSQALFDETVSRLHAGI